MDTRKATIHLKSRGVSVITCTKRGSYINNVFQNYLRQNWNNKELIIIINKDNIKMNKYVKMSKKYKNVSVYQLPSMVSLGECLNIGVAKTKFRYIAKFDDDDYYAPNYLKEAMQTFQRTGADVIGKRAYFIWLSGNKVLVLRFPMEENKFISEVLPGATLVIKKSVFEKVMFPNLKIGEDDHFCWNCLAKGFTLYSGGRYNFVAVRRKFSKGHTWVVSEKEIMKRYAKIFRKVKNYKSFVTE